MDIKEYLSRAYRINQEIYCKLDHIQNLRDLTTKVTSTLSEINVKTSKQNSKLEKNLSEIIDLEVETNNAISKLLKYKRDIIKIINLINNPEYKMVLELRYLCFKKWDQIASELKYSIDNVYKLHSKALKFLSKQKVYSKLQYKPMI